MDIVPIAVMSARDFARAKGVIPECAEYSGYEDWLDCRHGRFMGLSIAGVDSRLVYVPLKNFLSWCNDLGILPSEQALDAFAMLSEYFDANPFLQGIEPEGEISAFVETPAAPATSI